MSRAQRAAQKKRQKRIARERRDLPTTPRDRARNTRTSSSRSAPRVLRGGSAAAAIAPVVRGPQAALFTLPPSSPPAPSPAFMKSANAAKRASGLHMSVVSLRLDSMTLDRLDRLMKLRCRLRGPYAVVGRSQLIVEALDAWLMKEITTAEGALEKLGVSL